MHVHMAVNTGYVLALYTEFKVPMASAPITRAVRHTASSHHGCTLHYLKFAQVLCTLSVAIAISRERGLRVTAATAKTPLHSNPSHVPPHYNAAFCTAAFFCEPSKVM
eukprot:TRINITY_DN13577_c0_g1_i1.p1 TRINITY_DN13577_c0_g1~~TRINITY_DN13577_c0_g1_i1.p1  ORF type:complete len:108 (-),score=8.69 TRINITY_DN13577_c0_g1_i1:40-363(-)